MHCALLETKSLLSDKMNQKTLQCLIYIVPTGLHFTRVVLYSTNISPLTGLSRRDKILVENKLEES